MKKRDLKKLALLGLASGCLLSAPIVASEASSPLNHGIQIAKSCGSGCGGNKPAQGTTKSQTADNSDYAPSQGSCGGSRPAQGSSTSARPAQSGCGSSKPGSNSASRGYAAQGGCGGQQNRPSQQQQNDNSYTADNDDYQPSYDQNRQMNQPSYDQNRQMNQPSYDQNRQMNQPNSSKGYSAQGGCGGHQNKQNQRYTADNDQYADVNAKPSTQQEQDLMNQLNAEGKSQYQSLDAEGKALAVKLANDEYKDDKNEAVKVAAQKLASKRAAAY